MPIKYSLCNHPSDAEPLERVVIVTVHALLSAIGSAAIGVSR